MWMLGGERGVGKYEKQKPRADTVQHRQKDIVTRNANTTNLKRG